MKKAVSIILSMALVLGMVLPAFAAPLSDVPANHWAYEELSRLYASGLIVGFPDETFRGDESMTRYQFAEVMGKLLVRLDAYANKNASDIETLKEAIKQHLAAEGKDVDDAQAERLAESVQKLRTEFKTEIDQLGSRVTALENRVAVLEKENEELKSKTQSNLGLWGVILGAAGLAVGLLK